MRENTGPAIEEINLRIPVGVPGADQTAGRDECENLAVPVCLSATHIAYGSIRMEPVFMILGQSAATAAALAIDGKCSVQKLSYEELRRRLQADKQVLEWKAGAR